MGRKQKRIEQKKYKNKKIEEEETNEEMIKISSALKIILGVVIVIIVFYFGVALFVTKEVDLSSKSKNESSETAESNTSNVSNAILASNTFNQDEDAYYVYYYDFNDEEESISNRISSLTDYTVYRVDTASGLNSNYVDDNSNKNVTGIDNLKVKNPTIIKIDHKKVTAYYDGLEEISNFLNK